MAIFHQLYCWLRSQASAEQQNSERACQDLELDKANDTCVKPESPNTRWRHENIVWSCMQEVLVEIGAQDGQKSRPESRYQIDDQRGGF